MYSIFVGTWCERNVHKDDIFLVRRMAWCMSSRLQGTMVKTERPSPYQFLFLVPIRRRMVPRRHTGVVASVALLLGTLDGAPSETVETPKAMVVG
jgi:hypothetical protein